MSARPTVRARVSRPDTTILATLSEAFDSSVWVHRIGHWVCAVHTESLAGDPFGRHH